MAMEPNPIMLNVEPAFNSALYSTESESEEARTVLKNAAVNGVISFNDALDLLGIDHPKYDKKMLLKPDLMYSDDAGIGFILTGQIYTE